MAPLLSKAQVDSTLKPFYHGVASGDPMTNQVILWTKVTRDSTVTSGDPIEVQWRIATDTGMTNIINSGTGNAVESEDYTFKVDVTGLSANQCYYYDFFALGKYSIRGRTFTAPSGDIDSLRFAVVSSASYAHGYFNAYDRLRERNDFGAVIHLGNYIYEYGDGEFGNTRMYNPSTEVISISDYRERHAYYKLDSSLMRLHQQYPFIAIWADNDAANKAYKDGAENHNSGTEGTWEARKSNAKRAYFEYMPVRSPGLDSVGYRKIQYGDLVQFYMLDTGLEGKTENEGDPTNTSNTMLGSEQFDWLTSSLKNSTTQWNVLGQQMLMTTVDINPLPFGGPTYLDDEQWDGYQVERTKLYDSVLTNNIPNLITLSGDLASSWASDLPTSTYNSSTGAGSAGVEFSVSSVSSVTPTISVDASTIKSLNGHAKYVSLDKNGYMILDVNKTRTQCDWYHINTIDSVTSIENFEEGWFTGDGTRYLTQASDSSTANSQYGKTPAPYLPKESIINGTIENDFRNTVFVYPNPIDGDFSIDLGNEYHNVAVKILDLNERIILSKRVINSRYINLTLEEPAGIYLLQIETPKNQASIKIIKE